MWNDALAKNGIALLVLRFALAVVFLYHGWHKVADRGNMGGPMWAANLTLRNGLAPDDVLNRLDQWVQVNKERRQAGEAKEGEPLLPDDIANRIPAAYTQSLAPDVVYQQSGPGALQLQSSVQRFVAWGELAGGMALLLGFLTRLAALGRIVIQVGAIWLVTGAQGFSAGATAGYEYNLAVIGMCVALVCLGGGTLALNQLFWRQRQPARMKPEAAPVGAAP
jgi:uncharacterized membrane protein YphA (DoxX/SURF4 family)